jgi:hypothetical protein
MAEIPQRLKTKSNEWLAQRVMSLEDALMKCSTERDDLNAAFTSLSGLVMEQDPNKWAAWTQTHPAAEPVRETTPQQERHITNPYITPETEMLLIDVALAYDLPKRRSRISGKQVANISAAIRKAAEVALQVALNPVERESARERKEEQAK